MKKITIGVVGNPNCGKTTLFNVLTGAKQKVGNWPGVTVEKKTGRYFFEGVEFELVDLPGTYSLDVCEEEISVDERIARDYVELREADLILNIVDASNLERNLYLTSQLMEMKVPMLVALNMMDVAEKDGYNIDIEALKNALNCPVFAVVASSGVGAHELKSGLLEAGKSKPVPQKVIEYHAAVEQGMNTVIDTVLGEITDNRHVDKRWFALRLLEGDVIAVQSIPDGLKKRIVEIQKNVEQDLNDDIDILLADARYGFVHSVIQSVVTIERQLNRNITEKIDSVVLHRIFGIPIFLFAMYLMFMFTINVGGAFIDFFDLFTGAVFVDGLGYWLEGLGCPDWLILLMAEGMGGGVQVVATFIPVIAFLYLFISALEDSGYMARAAFVMDRAMRVIGLPGKAFIPLIVGFGCNVPAIMATRTLEQEKDRIMTILMAPFMSCGARLAVYSLFAAAFFPNNGQNIVFGLYLIGIGVAVLSGLLLKNTLLPGPITPFVMELPAYHVPTLKNILLSTWDRTQNFILKAGKIIVPMVMVLNVLNAIEIGTPDDAGGEKQSVLSEIGRGITPIFSPMGMEEENWPAAVGIFTGVLAKEAVVGTLDSLYRDLAINDNGADDSELLQGSVESYNLISDVLVALDTIPNNIKEAFGAWLDPLGLGVGNISDIQAAAEEQEVATGTFGAMAARFDGTAGAFAYLLLILLYFPCTAALAAVYRETNTKWTLFVAVWTAGVAYLSSTIYYQVATYSRHPVESSMWILSAIFIVVSVFYGLRWWGKEPIKVMPNDFV